MVVVAGVLGTVAVALVVLALTLGLSGGNKGVPKGGGPDGGRAGDKERPQAERPAPPEPGPRSDPPAQPWAPSPWHPKELVAVAGSENGRHWGPVRCVAHSADGKFIASGGDDKAVRIWEADTLKPVKVLASHEGVVLAVAFSDDGKRLASAGADQSVRLWDWTAEPLPEPDVLKWHQCPVAAVAFAPGGKALASAGASDGNVVLWDLSRANPKKGSVLPGHAPVPLHLVFSPDGKKLAVGNFPRPVDRAGTRLPDSKLWDLNRSEPTEKAQFTGQPVRFDKDGKKLAFMPTGSMPVSWTGLDDLKPYPFDSNPKKAGIIPDGTSVTVALSPAGNRLAVARWKDGTGEKVGVQLLHLDGPFWAEVELPDFTGPVPALAFSPDGKSLVSASGNDLRLWEVGADRPTEFVKLIDGHANDTYAFSPDGKMLALGGNKGISLYKIGDDGAKHWFALDQAFPNIGRQAVFGNDGKLLAARGKQGRVHLLDLTADPPKERSTLTHPEGTWEEDIAITPDGKTLATLTRSRDKPGVHVWDLGGDAPKQVAAFDTEDRCWSMRLSPDGKLLATSGDRILLWKIDGATVKKWAEIPVKGWATFLPDGKALLASGHHRDGINRISLWDLSGDQPRERARLDDVGGVGVTPDGKTVVTSQACWELSRDPPRLRERFRSAPHFWEGPHSSGRMILAGNKVALVLPLDPARQQTQARLYSLVYSTTRERPVRAGHAAPVRSVALAGGKLLATGSDDRTARLWDLTAEGLRPRATITAHEGPVTAIAFSPDGKKLATGSQDRTVLLWDVTGAEPKELPSYAGHNTAVTALAFSPDGKELAVSGPDGRVRLWDLAGVRPKEKSTLDSSSATYGGQLRAWVKDGKDPKPLNELPEVPAKVTATAAAADGKRLAACGADGKVVVWDAAGKKIRAWQMPGPIYGIAFSDDGRHLATANANGTAYILRLAD